MHQALTRPGSPGPAWLGSTPSGKGNHRAGPAEAPFVADAGWKRRALPRVEAALKVAFPSARPDSVEREAQLALWGLDLTWNHYKLGATASLFDVLRFLARFELPPEPVFMAEMTLLSVAALAGQKIVQRNQHANMLASHHVALVCRLRYEHVTWELGKGPLAMRLVPMRPSGEQREGFVTSGPAAPANRIEGKHAVDRSLRDAAAFLHCTSQELHEAAHVRFATTDGEHGPDHIRAAINAAIPLMPAVARPPVARAWDTVYRNYKECQEAVDTTLGRRPRNAMSNPFPWPGRYSLPSRSTCELLGWGQLFAAFEALGIRPDDPLFLMQLGGIFL